MDGQQVEPRSLLKELTRWIFLTTITVSILAGLTAGLLAFDEAREIQDEILVQIARTISNETTGNSNNWGSRQNDSNIHKCSKFRPFFIVSKQSEKHHQYQVYNFI